MQIKKDLKAAILALPKIELHIHLEGCISLATLQFLAKKNRITIPRHLAEKENIHFNNFEEFVATFYAICNSICEEEDFTFIARDLVEYIKQNNIIYCEVSWTPFLYLQRGFNFSKVMAILNDEIARHHLSSSIYFIIDTQRDHGTTAGELVFDKVLETKDANIKGIGLTGQEHGYSPSAYKSLYKKMQDHGYGCTAHAGEYGSALDVWQCLLDLEVKRIGHGIRAISDPALLEYIKQNDIHLEVSPTSNVRLNRVESFALHPVKKMIELGLSVGINSDDPGIFNTGLTDECINLLSVFDFERDTLKQCNTDAIKACFATADTKEKLLLEIRQKWK